MEKIKQEIELKQYIRSKAEELGFIRVSFAKYELLQNELSNYKDWIDSSYHADMNWMNKNFDKREDIRLILEDAESVIVLAHSYFTNQPYQSDDYKISRYAWGDDYHNVIINKIKILEQFIKVKYPSFNSKSYVDTGAILEKQWAVKSGLGWQGKNSLILNKDFGSYFFIGVIINNYPFENDEIEIDRCGSCKKCIDTCPTEAIISNKVIDSNKCISYWTIEAKPDKDLPDNIKNNLNGWAYGCDICQEVCPWNKNKPKITHELAFYPRHNETNFNYQQVKEFSEEKFKERFKISPIKRTKLNGIKRNLNIKEV